MRINWDTPVSELMHSDEIHYIDLDEDELIHWKYIKKKKLPNGKWRYYYKQSELDAAKAAADEALAAANKAQFEYEMSWTNRNATKESIQKAKKEAALLRDVAEIYVKKYEKQKVSTFVERTISKGIVAVANFFSNLFGKKKN